MRSLSSSGVAARRVVGRAILVPLLAIVTVPGSLGAQSEQTGVAALRGAVIDAETGAPLEGARVSLALEPVGLVATDAASALTTTRRVGTGPDGRYAFQGLPPGRYRLRVERIGYRAASLEIHYDGPADSRVSVGLRVEPVQLEPVSVVTERHETPRSGRLDARAGADPRVAAERLRQERYLASDVRVLTDHDAFESGTLAETDLLRALHRLPGVSAEDDWSAEPWVRGSRWHETRVYFDGLPLFNPTHLGGAFTSLTPDAVGSVAFHPGVRPIGAGEASAGVVELRSRPAGLGDPLSVLTRLSVLSGRISVDAPVPGGGVRLSGRRSYVDEATGGEPEGDGFPYRFWDLSGRWDQRLSDRVRLETSGVVTRDRVLGDLPRALKGTRAQWGDRAGRLSVDVLLGGVRARVTSGRSRFESEARVVPFDPGRDDLEDAATGADTWNRLTTDHQEIALSSVDGEGRVPRWRLALRRTDTHVEYTGPAPWPFPAAADAGSLEVMTELERYSFSGETRLRPHPELTMDLGLSMEASDGVPAGADPTILPRLQMAWDPSARWRFSMGMGRHLQYEQALGTAGFSFGPGLGPGHLWVSAQGDVPALRSDLLTVGAERWLPGGWLLSLNAFARNGSGHLTPSPDSGYVRASPPVESASIGDGWVDGTSRTHGFELDTRKLVGRVTGSLGYSYARARTDATGRTFPTPGAREHVLDAALVLQATTKTRVGATFTASSGAPYTRFFTFHCDEVSWYCEEEHLQGATVIGFKEPASQLRAPDYASLDLHVEKTGTLWGNAFGLYLQLRNVLGRENRSTYTGSNVICPLADGVTDCRIEDRFDAGIPTLPLLGFWMRW